MTFVISVYKIFVKDENIPFTTFSVTMMIPLIDHNWLRLLRTCTLQHCTIKLAFQNAIYRRCFRVYTNSGSQHCKFQGVQSTPEVLFSHHFWWQNNIFGVDSTLWNLQWIQKLYGNPRMHANWKYIYMFAGHLACILDWKHRKSIPMQLGCFARVLWQTWKVAKMHARILRLHSLAMYSNFLLYYLSNARCNHPACKPIMVFGKACTRLGHVNGNPEKPLTFYMAWISPSSACNVIRPSCIIYQQDNRLLWKGEADIAKFVEKIYSLQ